MLVVLNDQFYCKVKREDQISVKDSVPNPWYAKMKFALLDLVDSIMIPRDNPQS